MVRWARAHPVVVAIAILGLGGAVFVLVWFQPQKLIIEHRVVEMLPTPSSSVRPSASPTVLGAGRFRSLEHPTTGRASVVRLGDGTHVVRIEGLDTSNGPDLRVYLSRIPPDRGWHDYGDEYVDLGALKGNRGDQNYLVPSGVDVTPYRSVVIWCRRFRVGFGVAGLA